MVKWDGFVTYATLATKFQLPLSLITQVILTHHGSSIVGTLKVIPPPAISPDPLLSLAALWRRTIPFFQRIISKNNSPFFVGLVLGQQHLSK
jgi:hypothetical protein